MNDSDELSTSASNCRSCNRPLGSDGACQDCDATSPLPAGDLREQFPHVSGYRIVSHLGEGGMGTVYLAEDVTLDRLVAVKMVSSRVSGDPQLRSRFAREARTLATIEHPNVVRIYSFGESDGSPYLVMEYVKGETLSQRLARCGRLEVPEAFRILRQIAGALRAAWQRRVIHRDIKPSNVLLDAEDQVRVVDFGLAKPLHVDASVGDQSLTQSGYMIGTPHYVSPEQARGSDVDFRADIYSLGIMLYHMIAGERPFDGTTPVAIIARHLQDPVPRLENRIADATAGTDRLIARMTAKDPAARPQSYDELIDEIDEVLGDKPSDTLKSRAISNTSAAKSIRQPQLVPATMLVLLLIAAVVYYFYGHRSREIQRVSTVSTMNDDGRLVVAVTPFYGPDPDSEKEGRVMAALIERAVLQRLGEEKARVIGIDKTRVAVRDHESARALGTQLGVKAVIWGEAFALKHETEIQPHMTIIPAPEAIRSRGSRHALNRTGVDLDKAVADPGSAVKLRAEAPDQFELRKTSAADIGDLVVVVAGIHALEQGRASDALEFFRQSPQSAETLRLEAHALIQLDRQEEARDTIERAVAADSHNAANLTLLGDLQVATREYASAAKSYSAAEALGSRFSSTRGFVDRGVLYIPETFRSVLFTNRDETPTLYLLGIDTATSHVIERRALSGIPVKFTRDGETIVITVNTGTDESPFLEPLRFTHGTFDRPIWPPPNFLWRVRTAMAGRAIAANFLQSGLSGVRGFGKPFSARFVFSPTGEVDPKLPSTLDDLERTLRAEAQRDATQPWTPFLLALELRAEGRIKESESVLNQILSRHWPVEYWEFSWMAENCERLRMPAWSQRLAAKAIEQRKFVPGPPTFAWSAERLMNANFVRDAAMNQEGLDGYRSLQLARALTGFCPEGDDIAAVAWARWFASHGRTSDAERERAFAARVRRSGVNPVRAALKVDITTSFLLGAIFAFIYAVVATLILAIARARRNPNGSSAGIPRDNQLGRVFLIVTATVLVLAAFVLLANGIIEESWIIIVAAMTLLSLIGIATVVQQRIGTRVLVSNIRRREGITVAISSAVLLVLLLSTFAALGRLAAILVMPLGTSDAYGHSSLLRNIDTSRESSGNRDLQKFIALLKHDAEQIDGIRPVTDADWAATFDSPWRVRFSLLGEFGDLPLNPFNALVGALIVSGVLLLLVTSLRRRPLGNKSMRVSMFVIPGMWDSSRGFLLRPMLIYFGAGSCLLPLYFVLRMRSAFVLGPFSLVMLPNLLQSFPLPDGAHDSRALTFAAAMADPLAIAFVGTILLLFVSAVVLHVSRFPRIARDVELAIGEEPTIRAPHALAESSTAD